AVVAVSVCICVFFVSSRRRHTRFSRDWSSDVCSSDLFSQWILPNQKDLPKVFEFKLKLLLKDVVWLEVGKRVNYANILHAGSIRSEERRVGKWLKCRYLCVLCQSS